MSVSPGITTVKRSDRIIARKGVKQVSSLTSIELGKFVTVATAVNSTGNIIPAIFEKKNYREYFFGQLGPIRLGEYRQFLQTSRALLQVHSMHCRNTSIITAE